MSLVTPAEFKALTGSPLLESVIQGVIDREEAGLANPPPDGIGQLTGSRTEVFLLTLNHRWAELTLQRTTDAVAVTENGVAVDTEDIRILANQRTLMRLLSDLPGNTDIDAWLRGYWLGPVEVTYAPNDLEQVRRVIIELTGNGIASAKAALAGGILAGETTGTYSYTLGRTTANTLTPEQRRRALISVLLPKSGPGTMRIRSSIEGRHSLLGTVRPA